MTSASNVRGEWKYADVGLVFSGWNPLRWSNRLGLQALKENLHSSAESNRPILVRFHDTNGTLLLEKEFSDETRAQKMCECIISSGRLEKTSQDSWDPLGLTGPEGHLTKAATYVPGVGHAVNVTHYAMGKSAVADEGDSRVSNITSYVPVAGHVQAVLSSAKHGEFSDLAQKSAARSSGVAAAVAVGWATAPVAATTTGYWLATAAVSGGLSAGAGYSSQLLVEHLCVSERNQEKAKQGIADFVWEVNIGVLCGPLAEIAACGATKVGSSMVSAFTREVAEEVGEQSMRIAFAEGSSEIITAAVQKAAAEEATESVFKQILQNEMLQAGVKKGVMDTPEYQQLQDQVVAQVFSKS